MPIKIKDSLPAQKVLEGENIFVMTEYRAMHQDIRPLKVLILNLMPTKIETETQILRKLSNTPLQVEVEFMQTASYQPRHVAASHLETFYTVFDEVKDRNTGRRSVRLWSGARPMSTARSICAGELTRGFIITMALTRSTCRRNCPACTSIM